MGALDGLRAVAVAAVVFYHLSPRALPSGFLGVDVFMAVSGFIITTLLLRERERTGRIRVAAFWGRRFRRLVPALVFLVVVVSVIVQRTGPTALMGPSRSQGLSSLLYVTNWRLIGAGVSYGGGLAARSPFVHLWSLAVEEQFYLVWPLLLFGLLFLSRKREWIVATVTGLMALGSMAWMAYLYDPGRDPLRIYYGTDTRAHAFLFGALGALVAPHLRTRGRRIVRVVAPCALVGVLVTMATDSPDVLYRGGFGLVAIATTLVALATTMPGPVAALLDRDLLRRLGRASYGIYLWHWPAVALLTPERVGVSGITLLGARLAFTAAGATVSSLLVERPLTVARPARVALAGGIGIGVATAALIALPVGPAFAYSNLRTDRVRAPIVYASARHHVASVSSGRVAPMSAKLPMPNAGTLSLPPVGTAMLVGDSGMYSATPALAAALDAAGWRVVETAYPGIGLTSLDGALQREWTDSARQYHVDLTIVMVGSWDVAWEQEHGAAAYRAVVERSLASFTSARGKVLWLSILPGGGKNDRPLDRFYSGLAARHRDRVQYVDIESALRAPDGTWPRISGGRILRQVDGWHLCPDGAAAVTHTALAHISLDRAGWEAGAWRGDERYTPSSEGCRP